VPPPPDEFPPDFPARELVPDGFVIEYTPNAVSASQAQRVHPPNAVSVHPPNAVSVPEATPTQAEPITLELSAPPAKETAPDAEPGDADTPSSPIPTNLASIPPAEEEPVSPLSIGEAIASVALEAAAPTPARHPEPPNPFVPGERTSPTPPYISEGLPKGDLPNTEGPVFRPEVPNTSPKSPPYIIPPAEVYAGEELHMITVILRTGYDKVRDNLRLRQCYGILISYSGHDRFALHIFERSRGYRVEFPNYTTTYCAELVARLGAIVGQDNILVEPLRLH
jgi:hypothetical protein